MSVLNADAADTLVFNDACEGNGGIKIGYYGSINEAASYFSQRLYNKPWTRANRRQQEAALAEATLLVNNLRYWGAKTDDTQDNEFPRNGSTIVPVAVRRATYEITIVLLDGFDIEKEIKGLQVTGEGYASARANYDRTAIQEHIRNGIPSFKAWELLVPYLADPQVVNMVRVG